VPDAKGEKSLSGEVNSLNTRYKKKPGSITSISYLGEEVPGLLHKITTYIMNKQYVEKVFSTERMQDYFKAHPGNLDKAMLHYQCNLQISEAFYPCISVLEIALKNALNQQLIRKFNCLEWYTYLPKTPGLKNLYREIIKAEKQLSRRGEIKTPAKIVAELTLGFWVRLFNAEYEMILWKDLRRAFPNLTKSQRQRKNVSPPLNHFRNLRNRIFHHEPICWSFSLIKKEHDEIIQTLGWINHDLPEWIKAIDRFEEVLEEVQNKMRN
jgi:hypothetical protein